MSSLIDKFPGAEVVAGSVVYNRKTVILLRDGAEIMTPEGEEELKRVPIDVVATVVATGESGKPDGEVKAVPRAPRKPKPAPAGAVAPNPEPELDVDSLLASTEVQV